MNFIELENSFKFSLQCRYFNRFTLHDLFYNKIVFICKTCNEFLPPGATFLEWPLQQKIDLDPINMLKMSSIFLTLTMTRFQRGCNFRVFSSSSTWRDIAAPNSFSLLNKNCQVLLSIKTRASQTQLDWKCFFTSQFVYSLLCF